MTSPVHHLELWTHDLAGAEGSWDWLLRSLGWVAEHPTDWPQGRIWRHPDGVYLVLEQSPDVVGSGHERRRPGLNHLALRAPDRAVLDDLRREAAARGWHEMYAVRYPHAGGPGHVALYLENTQGFEVELVAG